MIATKAIITVLNKLKTTVDDVDIDCMGKGANKARYLAWEN